MYHPWQFPGCAAFCPRREGGQGRADREEHFGGFHAAEFVGDGGWREGFCDYGKVGVGWDALGGRAGRGLVLFG